MKSIKNLLLTAGFTMIWCGPAVSFVTQEIKYASLDFGRSVSPMSYVNPTSPVVIIFHDETDPIVPYSQSVQLFKKLKQVGVNSQLATVENGQHGKFSVMDKQRINEFLWVFLADMEFP